MKEKTRKSPLAGYESPLVEVLDISLCGMICASPTGTNEQMESGDTSDWF